MRSFRRTCGVEFGEARENVDLATHVKKSLRCSSVVVEEILETCERNQIRA